MRIRTDWGRAFRCRAAQALRLLPQVARALAGHATVTIESCESQIGSGSLPGDRLPSVALAIRAVLPRHLASARVERLARTFRALPIPLIGRVHGGALFFDLRSLADDGR